MGSDEAETSSTSCCCGVSRATMRARISMRPLVVVSGSSASQLRAFQAFLRSSALFHVLLHAFHNVDRDTVNTAYCGLVFFAQFLVNGGEERTRDGASGMGEGTGRNRASGAKTTIVVISLVRPDPELVVRRVVAHIGEVVTTSAFPGAESHVARRI